jgi:hypothetical protein
MKAQTSLEALAAFAALLFALALLASQAHSSASAFSGSADASAERIRVSYAALSLDTAGSTLHAVQVAAPEGITADRWQVVSGPGAFATEPVFHEVFAQGDVHVVGSEEEQV